MAEHDHRSPGQGSIETVVPAPSAAFFGGARRPSQGQSNKPPLNPTMVWLVAGIVAMALGAILIVAGFSIRSHHTPNAAYVGGIETTGTVTSALGCSRYVIATDVVTFAVRGVTYTASSTDLCGAVGDHATVSYLPRSPETARVLVDQNLFDANAAIAIGAVVISAASFGLLRLRNKSKQHSISTPLP